MQSDRAFQFESLEERKLLSVAAAPSAAVPIHAKPKGLTVFANRNVSRMFGNQVETKVAINPRHPNNIVAVSENQANGGSTILISKSFDAGVTWQPSTFGRAQDGVSFGDNRPDARVAFDSFGNCYVCYMVGAAPDEILIELARSSDGGKTFSTTTAVGQHGIMADDPAITTGVDARNRKRQAVWISYSESTSGIIQTVFATSSRLGQLSKFSSPRQVSGERGIASTVAIGPKGQVVIAWETPDDGSGPGNILVSNDPDGAGTKFDFGGDEEASHTNVGPDLPIPAQPNRHIDAEPQLAFDNSTGSTRGRLYLVYTDANPDNSADTDIVLRHSDNLGDTWSGPIFANDDNTFNSQFLPALAVDPKSGWVGISWLDCRNSSNNTAVQEFATVSKDHGHSVLPNARVSAGTSSQRTAQSATPRDDDLDFGDNTGVAFFNRKMISSWSDNSNATADNPNGTQSAFDIYTASVLVR